MTACVDTRKPFAGERFVFADSQSLGPAPWDTRLQTPKRGTIRGGLPYRKRRLKCSTSINVPKKRLMLLSLGFTFLAWKDVMPCHVAVTACYISQVICEIDRTFFSSSITPLCKLALTSHKPDVHQTQTCPTTVLWSVKPYISHSLLSLWRPTAASFNWNYAANGGGATILRHYTSKTHDLPPPSMLGSLAELIFGYNPQYANINGAGIILEESIGVGECWRMSGGLGHVAINLSEPVFISHIAMDHASPSLLSEDDIASAPKSVALWALPPPNSPEYDLQMPIRSLNDFKSTKNANKDDLPISSQVLQIIDFQYNVRQPTRQIFPVPSRRRFPTQTVILEVKTNEGSDTACIYWLGIYGYSSRSVS